MKMLTLAVVLLELKLLKKHTDELVSAVRKKVAEENVRFLDLDGGSLNQAFDEVIRVHNRCVVVDWFGLAGLFAGREMK
jgi:hypothetical protein